jgi:hypothetical protein
MGQPVTPGQPPAPATQPMGQQPNVVGSPQHLALANQLRQNPQLLAQVLGQFGGNAPPPSPQGLGQFGGNPPPPMTVPPNATVGQPQGQQPKPIQAAAPPLSQMGGVNR